MTGSAVSDFGTREDDIRRMTEDGNFHGLLSLFPQQIPHEHLQACLQNARTKMSLNQMALIAIHTRDWTVAREVLDVWQLQIAEATGNSRLGDKMAIEQQMGRFLVGLYQTGAMCFAARTEAAAA